MKKRGIPEGGLLNPTAVLAFFKCMLVLLIPVASTADPGQQLAFHRLPVNNALTQNTVVDMLQDRRGLMWFATLGGLDVYDGYEFRTIPSDPREGDSLTGVHVSRIHEDRSGNVWVAGFRGWLDRIESGSDRIHHYAPELYGDPNNTRSGPTAFHETEDGELLIGTVTGLHRYDADEDRFVHGIDREGEHPGLGGIWDIIPGRDGWLWIASTRGLYRYDPSTGSRERFSHDPADPGSLPDSQVTRLLLDSRDRLWAGTALKGLARLDPGASAFKTFRADDSVAGTIASDQISDMMEDSQGRIWIANQSGGLSQFVSDDAGFEVYRHDPNDPGTISGNDVWSLLEDRTGLIWIGTAGGGLNQINPSRSRFETLRNIPFNENSLRSSFVWDLAEDDSGTIWMATLAGIESYAPEASRYRHFAPEPGGVSANQMQSVALDANGYVWAGGVNGSLFRIDDDGGFTEVFREDGPDDAFDFGRIWMLFSDGDRMWAGAGSGLYAISIDSLEVVEVLPASDALPMRPNPIRSMLPEPDGGYWIGSAGAGLARFVPGQGVVEHFRHDLGSSQSLSNNVVRSLYMTGNGDLWVGTLNGLNHISRADLEAGRNRFSLYAVADGLPNNTIYGIVPDAENHLWLSTNSGLSRFTPASGEFENFDVADGLPTNELNGGAELHTDDGRIYFGGVDGVAVIDAAGLTQNDTVPGIVITGVSLGGKPLPVERAVSGDTIQVPSGANDIGIEFAVADYHQPEKNSFQYRLTGASDEWRTTDQRRISFNRLAAGSYRFEVRGSNNDGVWSESIASVGFRVLPPPWRSTTAYVIYAALLFLGLATYHQQQRRRLAREREFSNELKHAHSLAEANHQMALRYAHFDQLTQLPNRSSLLEALARYMRNAGEDSQELVVVLINLDRFQRINDSFGHAIGDRVLKTIAGRLEAMIADDDYLARIGPDEFVWLALIDAPDDISRWARGRADEINRTVGRPFDFQEPPVVMTASIGCAVYRDGPESASDLLGYADVALHRAKEEEHPRVRCYEPAMSDSAHQHITIEARLKQALETDEFSAHYQPLVAIPGRELKALEALIRWNPVDGDPIFPDQFIPIAEQSGLIVDLGNWMIRHVCRQLAAWRDYEPRDIQVAINVSMRQLRSGTLITTLREALAETGVAPGALKIEITESAMMENVEDTAEQLTEVSQLGIDISVDDFGTGFSSLSHLKMLPVNELKIDRSFIADMTSSAESRTIVMSIVRLAHELNLRVVAEGVEDGRSLDWLAEIGCDIAQGYFFAKPLPPEQLVSDNWIRLARTGDIRRQG